MIIASRICASRSSLISPLQSMCESSPTGTFAVTDGPALRALFEELAGERTDEFVDILAYHYEHAAADEDADLAWAGDEVALSAVRGRAYGALLVAGKVARRRFALDRAVELHERSVALASTDAAAAACWADRVSPSRRAVVRASAPPNSLSWRSSAPTLSVRLSRCSARARMISACRRICLSRLVDHAVICSVSCW